MKKARVVASDRGEGLVVSPGHIDHPTIRRNGTSQSRGSDSDSGWEMPSPNGNHSRFVRAKKRSKEHF